MLRVESSIFIFCVLLRRSERLARFVSHFDVRMLRIRITYFGLGSKFRPFQNSILRLFQICRLVYCFCYIVVLGALVYVNITIYYNF